MKLIVTSAILAAVAIFADGVEARGKGRAPRAVPQLEGCEVPTGSATPRSAKVVAPHGAGALGGSLA
ncbi:hypothetical protein OC835_002421 [Tilletia horrida]|nr:hypothetical protein OC835_002421 [Tilletia horrida]